MCFSAQKEGEKLKEGKALPACQNKVQFDLLMLSIKREASMAWCGRAM